MKRRLFWFIALFLLICNNANAQELAFDTATNYHHRDVVVPIAATQMDSAFLMVDTLMPAPTPQPELQTQSAAEPVKKTFRPNPNRSVWLSAVLPGLGQIYNRRYWKLPIIYGGFAGCIYAIQWNGKYYKDYLAAYKDIMDADPNTQSYLDVLPYGTDPESSYAQSYLDQKQNFYRKYRDLSIIITVGVYALSIIDAFVDAQLYDFDISEDVSMKITPAFIENPQNPSLAASNVGMRFKINF